MPERRPSCGLQSVSRMPSNLLRRQSAQLTCSTVSDLKAQERDSNSFSKRRPSQSLKSMMDKMGSKSALLEDENLEWQPWSADSQILVLMRKLLDGAARRVDRTLEWSDNQDMESYKKKVTSIRSAPIIEEPATQKRPQGAGSLATDLGSDRAVTADSPSSASFKVALFVGKLRGARAQNAQLERDLPQLLIVFDRNDSMAAGSARLLEMALQ
eukprot:7384720-Prymnesium_polylepis.1